jgi:hypothetical protein
MTKKLAPKKSKVTPKDHTDDGVKVSVEETKKNKAGVRETKIKKGAVVEDAELDSNPATQLPEGKAIVGLSKGLTINLGNYESARINCWISRTAKDDETEIMNNMAEISTMLDEQLEFEVDELKQEN